MHKQANPGIPKTPITAGYVRRLLSNDLDTIQPQEWPDSLVELKMTQLALTRFIRVTHHNPGVKGKRLGMLMDQAIGPQMAKAMNERRRSRRIQFSEAR